MLLGLFVELNVAIWIGNSAWIADVCLDLGQHGYTVVPWFEVGPVPVWHLRRFR